jgi:hypothetical protein
VLLLRLLLGGRTGTCRHVYICLRGNGRRSWCPFGSCGGMCCLGVLGVGGAVECGMNGVEILVISVTSQCFESQERVNQENVYFLLIMYLEGKGYTCSYRHV